MEFHIKSLKVIGNFNNYILENIIIIIIINVLVSSNSRFDP